MDRPDPKSETKVRRRPLLRAFLVLQFSLLVAFVTLEVAARALPLEIFSISNLDPASDTSGIRFQPHPYVTFVPRKSWQTPQGRKLVAHHNSLGFRGAETTWKKPEGRFRIVCLGGSSTYGYTTTNDEATYPVRLEQNLRKGRPDLDLEVINCGAPGFTSFESMSLLASRAIALEPDVVIVYHGLNDAQGSLYRSKAKPEAPVQVDNTHYRNNWVVSSPSALERGLTRSRAYMVLRRYFTDYALRQKQLNAALVVDHDPSNKKMFANPNPSAVGFANFERNLRSIVGIAEAHGARVVLATQGTDYVDFTKKNRDPGGAQKLACQRNGETVRRVARSLPSVHLADIAPRLEALADKRKAEDKDDVFTDTVHFTNHGAGILANMMANELRAASCLPPR